jgi:Outer membrane protein beta-barrel domain
MQKTCFDCDRKILALSLIKKYNNLNNIMKKLILALLLSTTTIYVRAQDIEQNTQQAATSTPATQNSIQKNHLEIEKLATMSLKLPNYGSLLVSWGLDFLIDHPSKMDLNPLSSRFTNLCLLYNIRLGQSHFVISPGIGVAFDGYEFKNTSEILTRDEASRSTVFKKASEFLPKSTKIIQSSFDNRYIDIMLEVRFNTNNKYPKEGFFIALGGKMGLLWRASTTVKYQQDDETKTQTNSEFFNLERMRGGLHAKLGWGRFGLCYTHMISNLFKPNKGPDSTTTNTCNLGISIDLF